MADGISDILRSRLMSLIRSRNAKNSSSTICPSEVPRTLERDGEIEAGTWREHMDATREIVFGLRDEGVVEVLQKGDVIHTGLEDVRGPIRVRLVETEK